ILIVGVIVGLIAGGLIYLLLRPFGGLYSGIVALGSIFLMGLPFVGNWWKYHGNIRYGDETPLTVSTWNTEKLRVAAVRAPVSVLLVGVCVSLLLVVVRMVGWGDSGLRSADQLHVLLIALGCGLMWGSLSTAKLGAENRHFVWTPWRLPTSVLDS